MLFETRKGQRRQIGLPMKNVKRLNPQVTHDRRSGSERRDVFRFVDINAICTWIKRIQTR